MRKHQHFRILVPLALSLFFTSGSQAQSSPSNANILVVVNAKSGAPSTITQRDLSDIYLGRSRSLPNGQSVMALDHGSASSLRARFYKALTGKAITDINAYWARLLFTGQSSPPQSMADGAAVTEALKSNPGLIGYVEHAQMPNPEALGLRVLLTIHAP